MGEVVMDIRRITGMDIRRMRGQMTQESLASHLGVKKQNVYALEKGLRPLTDKTLEMLCEVEAVSGGGRYVFPTARTGRCISDMAMNTALRSMGIGKEVITGHGFRAMARTLLDEVLHFRVDYIEHQLAHAVKDPLGRAYNLTTHIKERTAMMQHWADYLDGLKSNYPHTS